MATATALARLQHGSERGIALVVALILLVVVTLLGLGAIRATTMQQRMSGNFADRQAAFQTAEVALQDAATALPQIDNNGNLPAGTKVIDCSQPTDSCTDNPFAQTTPSVESNIQAVSDLAVTVPQAAQGAQFVIQYMGRYTDQSTATGVGQTGAAAQKGAQGLSTTSPYFRITARSGDPIKVGARAVVTLQAYYKQ